MTHFEPNRPDVDVLIIGAGLSGIGMACHLKRECEDLSFRVLEAREDLGGTWDLFRYPGVRSDSDMHTLGYSFRPWKSDQAIAAGGQILEYIRETAEEYGVTKAIEFGRQVTHLAWSSSTNQWTVRVRTARGEESVRARFVMVCAGYYRYDKGYTPAFANQEAFEGVVAHPQLWDPTIDYEGKRVVVIGSGATAVTLVPELAKKAASVVMLQRSPSYVLSLPPNDAMAAALFKVLETDRAYRYIRGKNSVLGLLFFTACKRAPKAMRRLLTKRAATELEGSTDVDVHFSPRYDPWDQRVCFAPDGDLFAAIRDGRAEVITGAIDQFEKAGIKLKDGRSIEADLIVTATGLELQFLGGASVEIDGQSTQASEHFVYKGVMLSDVPNLGFSVGYTNASWTLKVDLTARYICRLLRHMRERGAVRAIPKASADLEQAPLLDLDAGYIRRAGSILPKGGDQSPFRQHQNYLLDRLQLSRHQPIEDGVLELGFE